MRRSIALALIPGDGIGPEVVGEAVKVLEAGIHHHALPVRRRTLPRHR
jgi:isocitrate/isopropylmalate dehydrogenase